MIRSNVLLRRIASASAVVPKHAGPFTASATSSAIDVPAASSRGALSAASPANHFRFPPPPTTALPSSPRRFSSDAASELGAILQREIEEEESAAAELDGGLPPELADLDAEIRRTWTVVEGISGVGGGRGETGSGATMRMFRKEAGSKGAKIGIVFHCQDTEDDVRFDENEVFGDRPADEGGAKEEEEEMAQAVRFGVTVSKGGKTVVLQCRSDSDGLVNVESVMVRDGDAESVLAMVASGEGMHAALYQVSSFVLFCG